MHYAVHLVMQIAKWNVVQKALQFKKNIMCSRAGRTIRTYRIKNNMDP